MNHSHEHPAGWSLDEFFDRGIERFREVIGDEAADGVLRRRAAAAAAGDDAGTALPFAMTWGWLLDRPGLTVRERCLALLSADVTMRASRALQDHLRLALNIGITAPEIGELLLQLGPYCGFPATVEARAVLAKVLDEVAAAEPVPSAWGWLGRPATTHRVRIVVADARETARHFASLLGLARWTVARVDPSELRTRLDGHPLKAGFVSARLSDSSGIRFELVQPTGGATTFHRKLVRSGTSIHDVGLVSAGGEELAGLERRAFAAGVRTAQTMELRGANMTWLDTRSALGGYYLAAGDVHAWDEALGADEEWDFSDLTDPDLDYSRATIAHLGVVVGDVEARSEDYARAFGQREWPVLKFSTESGSLVEARYEGRKGPDDYLSSSAPVGAQREVQPIGGASGGRRAPVPQANIGVELIQPLGGPSRYREGYHQRFGDGIQHLYFGAVPDDEGWARLVAAFGRHGVSTVTIGSAFEGAVDYAYFDTLAALGFDVEIFRHHAAIDREKVASYVMSYPG